MVLVMIITAMIAAMGIAYVSTTVSQEKMVNSSIDNTSYEQAAFAGFDIAKAFLIAKYASGWDAQLVSSVANSGTYIAGSTSIRDGVIANYTTGYTTWFQWNRNIYYQGNTYFAKIENNTDGGTAIDDQDGTLKLTVEAWGGGNTSTMRSQQILLEGMVHYKVEIIPFAPTSAVVVGGSLNVFGNVDIAGTNASIQSNGSVTVTGSANVGGDVTAVGSVSAGAGQIDGTANPNSAETAIPSINPPDYKYLADKIFKTNGLVYDAGDNLVATPAGWSYSGGTWSKTANVVNNGVYYFDGADVDIGGSAGSAANPMTITIIATGYINVTGSPSLMPNPAGGGIGLMAGTDLRMRGAGGNVYGTGLYAAHEQVSMVGTPTVVGCVLAEDYEDVCTLVTSASDIYGEVEALGGNTSITYNGGLTTVLTTTDGNPYIQVLGFKKRIKARY
jgi:hypothetical protein